ncbi:aldo/keto reductase [Streptomyces massasporeus]|uniref:aldo/keto reductase n=1 Tax=Streptomyces massasporeus TaxID=67324 RepID=UPI0019C5003B|nr:aldo/keto reductase [Streptomyces massasporeus]GGV86284.1 hypothetical protein GCM10010228_66990 [Streptomyces massasporeus]
MRYRERGRSGLSVSEIGYGAWGIGESAWFGAGEDESVRALRRALDLGVNLVDTTRGYGESERIVGRVVRELAGDEVLVATKVPPLNRLWPAPDGVAPPIGRSPVSTSATAWRPACARAATTSTWCSSMCGATNGPAAVSGWRRSRT